jgi:hypothetical protein
VFEHDRDRGGLRALGGQRAERHAAELVDRQPDLHGDAAHRPHQDDALAVKVDLADLAVSAAVARRIARGQSERVEPQRTARPHRPVDTHGDASKLSHAGLLCPVAAQPCVTVVGLGLRVLVNRR